MIIAIDGPAGSGKSSTARAVAGRLGFRHLDSGALYRALTWAALQRGYGSADFATLEPEQLDALGVRTTPGEVGFRITVDGRAVADEIRGPDVTAAVSAMARVPVVREWLLDTLRDAARGCDLVADGRDIGTVVFPDADLKVFLVAQPGTRARRRLLQEGREPTPDALAEEIRRISARDAADAGRDVAPLRPADDAIMLDTTELDFSAQVDRIVGLAREIDEARASS